MTKSTITPGARELFRYARVFPPRIIDLQSRIKRIADSPVARPKASPKASPKNSAKKAKRTVSVGSKSWARQFKGSHGYVNDLASLELDVFRALKIEDVPEDVLPCKKCIADGDAFLRALDASAPELDLIHDRVTLSLYADAVLGEQKSAARLNRILQFLELLPTLSQTNDRTPYAPAVLMRHREKQAPTEQKTAGLDKASADSQQPKDEDSTRSSKQILEVWDATNEYVRWRKQTLEEEIEALKGKSFHFEGAARSGRSKKKAPSERQIKADRRRQYGRYIREKREALKALVTEYRELGRLSIRERIELARTDKGFLDQLLRKYGTETVAAINTIEPPVSHVGGFCELYSKQKDREQRPSRAEEKCEFSFGDPCLEKVASDFPNLGGAEDVRPIGVAELITVEENWLRYKTGEISAIESVLKGEVRKKEVKSRKYFEEMTEQLTQETTEEEAQTESKMKQELSSQIETELASRFNSDISSSLNGSGGGTIGVVNFEGGASLGAGIGLGLDTAMSTSSESNFSQEIISKALERTRKVSSEFRRSRSHSLFETTTLHKIDNSGPKTEHSNGIYCFLDKEVCISERVYGVRKFLNAEILRPGNALIKKEMQKHLLKVRDGGNLPDFELVPSEITPENYMELVGKYRASNVSPPPAHVKVVSKTYKTDITNENREQNELKFKKVAEVLAPFFGQYKRFLIQDEIEIPEGYRVQEVKVTVTHGSNGVSIPAHLPFSLMGASIFAMPTLAAAAIPPYTFYYLPFAIWQILFTASPLLHYNADSSNVTINVGHQTAESPYFFFQPDQLITEVIDALSNSSIISEDFIEFIQGRILTLHNTMTAVDNNALIDALTDVSDNTKENLNTFVTDLNDWLSNLVTSSIPAIISNILAGNSGGGSGAAFPPFPSVPVDELAKIPKAILAPFESFFNSIVEHMDGLVSDVLGDIFAYFTTMLDNTDTKEFSNSKGFVGKLPVSFNCIALKPGITINFSACLVRIEEESLDAWRLETYDRLNQAYYQLQADHENAQQMRRQTPVHRSNPSLMRQEEREVLKFHIIRLLHRKYSQHPDADLHLEEIKLFEHAIDWENLTFRVFNYGPSGLQVAFQKIGLYDTADERRKQFMESLWAQAMIPLRDDERLEQVMIHYMNTGEVDFEAQLLAQLSLDSDEPLNELTEIYRDMVLRRQRLPEVEPRTYHEILPTELIAIYQPKDDEPYPVNDIVCPDSIDAGEEN